MHLTLLLTLLLTVLPKKILVDAELIKQFKEMETLPDTEKNTILKVVTAYIRDLKTKQAYIL